MTENPEEQHEEGTMTIWEHLEELRARMVKALLAAVLGAALGWYFRGQLLHFLLAPLLESWPTKLGPAAINVKTLPEGFLISLKVAILGGFIMAFPLIAYQLWAFVAPGLYKKEKRYTLLFVASSCGLFAIGSYFSWRFAIPAGFRYMLEYLGPDVIPGVPVVPTLMISDYVNFVTKLLMAFGLIFELPVVVLFLSVAGLINHTHLIKFFRYFVVIAFVISAILTPPDPISQLLMALPLVGLYGFSIGVAYVFGRKKDDTADSKT